jgi:hypothetical protein
MGFSTLTAGGDFRPALRTSAVRHERPAWNYKARSAVGKSRQPAETACIHAKTRIFCANRVEKGHEEKVNELLTPRSDSGLFSN